MDDDPRVKYEECLLVREGYLMQPNWMNGEPLPTCSKRNKTKRPGDDRPVQVLEEANFRPMVTSRKVTRWNIPNYRGCRSSLEDYREVAERLEQKQSQGGAETHSKVRKSDYQGEGADLLPIVDGVGIEGYLWADLCMW